MRLGALSIVMHCMPTFSFYWQIKASVLFFYSRIWRWWHDAAYYFCKYDDGEDEELGRRWGGEAPRGELTFPPRRDSSLPLPLLASTIVHTQLITSGSIWRKSEIFLEGCRVPQNVAHCVFWNFLRYPALAAAIWYCFAMFMRPKQRPCHRA